MFVFLSYFVAFIMFLCLCCCHFCCCCVAVIFVVVVLLLLCVCVVQSYVDYPEKCKKDCQDSSTPDVSSDSKKTKVN